MLSDALGLPGVRVRGLHRLSGGASRETFAFDAVLPDGVERPLVLQRERPGGAISTGGGTAMEAALLRAAAAQGVPVPGVIAAGSERRAGPLGAPFVIVDRLEGETIPRRILREPEFAEARRALAAQCGRALAGIHRIPLEAASGLEERDQVAQFREILDALGQPHPAFELAFRWLEANRPPRRATTVVHGDFRNGNLIVGPDGLSAVLDWELAHLGDPMEDLGWLCVKAWRFGSPHPVGGFGPYGDLFDAYAEAAGLTGVSRSVELAAIGRRVCENEHDVLLMLP